MLSQEIIKKSFDNTLGKLGFTVEVVEPTTLFRKAHFWDLKISSSINDLKEFVIGIHKTKGYISDFDSTFVLPKQEVFRLGISLDVKGSEIDLFTDELLVGVVWKKEDKSTVSADLHFEGMLIEDFVSDQNKFLLKLKEHRHFILQLPATLNSLEASPEDRKTLIGLSKKYWEQLESFFASLPTFIKELTDQSN